jgi:hypothetical protein
MIPRCTSSDQPRAVSAYRIDAMIIVGIALAGTTMVDVTSSAISDFID